MERAKSICPQCKNSIIDEDPFDTYIIPICEAYNCSKCSQCVIDAKPKEPKRGLICKEYKWNLDRLITVDAMVPCSAATISYK
jgi:hypothetical protein